MDTTGAATSADSGPGPVAIRTQDLTKRYGELTAVDGLDLEVRPARSSACSVPTAPARRRRS